MRGTLLRLLIVLAYGVVLSIAAGVSSAAGGCGVMEHEPGCYALPQNGAEKQNVATEVPCPETTGTSRP